MATLPKVIFLKTESVIFKSGKALEIITPGMLIEEVSTGLQKASVAGGNARKMFADFQDYFGKGIDDACAVGDKIPYGVPAPGSEVYAYVAASATAITFGAPVQSDGLGGVMLHTPTSVVESGSATKVIYADVIVGYAKEAVDNSAVLTATRIKIEAA